MGRGWLGGAGAHAALFGGVEGLGWGVGGAAVYRSVCTDGVLARGLVTEDGHDGGAGGDGVGDGDGTDAGDGDASDGTGDDGDNTDDTDGDGNADGGGGGGGGIIGGDGDAGRARQLSRRVQLQNWVGSERASRERSPRPTRCHRARNRAHACGLDQNRTKPQEPRRASADTGG